MTAAGEFDDPARDEILEPRTLRGVVHRATFEVKVTRLRARLIHADASARGPAMHHGVGDIGMKLEAERVAVLIGLHRKVIALGKQLGAIRQFKSFAMPVVDPLRPVREQRTPRCRRTDRIVADLHPPFTMRRDLGAQLFGKHLRAQADAEERPLLTQGNLDPVDLAAHIVVGIIGAHRAAEDHRAGVLLQRVRQGIAEPRTADVEGMAERPQRVADPSRRRRLLVKNDQNRQQGRRPGRQQRPLARKGQDGVANFSRSERHRNCLWRQLKPERYLGES